MEIFRWGGAMYKHTMFSILGLLSMVWCYDVDAMQEEKENEVSIPVASAPTVNSIHDSSFRKLLCDAIKKWDKETIIQFFQLGAAQKCALIEAPWLSTNYFVLDWVIQNRDAASVKFLVDAQVQAFTDHADQEMWHTWLIQRTMIKAIKYAKLDLVRLVLETEKSIDVHSSALFAATYFNFKQAVILLLSAYAQTADPLVFVDKQDAEGRTALLMAVARGNHLIAQLLLKAGADVNHQDNEGNTTAILAIKYIDDFQALREMLDILDKPVGKNRLNLYRANKYGESFFSLAHERGFRRKFTCLV
jgi:hypothetical protein